MYLESLCEISGDSFKSSASYNLKTCLAEWIGDDAKGMLCYSNNDCTSKYGSGWCDLSLNRCGGVRKQMEMKFLECLLELSNSVTRTAIFAELLASGVLDVNNLTGTHSSDSVILTAEILAKYLTGMDCVSDYGPMSSKRKGYVSNSLLSSNLQLCRAVCNLILILIYIIFDLKCYE